MNKIIKNMATSILFIGTYMITSIVVQQKILVSFGSDINGISSSISQFLSYLALLEAGIGTASIQALYKPLSDNHWGDINAILSATRKQYNRIGLLFFGLLFVVACILPIMVAGQLDAAFVAVFTIISGLNTLFSYVLVGKYSVFLTANQKISVIYVVDTVLHLVFCVGKIVAINMGMSILLVQFLSAVSTMLKALLLYLYVRKNYKPMNTRVPPAMDKLGKHKSVMVHNIAGLVVNHTDVTLLTAISTLKNVSLYSVYNLIYSNISMVINTVFANAPQGTFGYLATKGKAEYRDYYYAFEFLYFIVLYVILTAAIVLTLPFISLYTKGVDDVNYISRSIALLFFLNQFMSLLRIPSVVTIKAFGWFQETKKGAVIEAIINLTVSLALLPVLGIQGLLLGTFCSYLFRTQDTIVYVYKHCGLKKGFFIKNNLINMAVSGAFIGIFLFAEPLQVTGWLNWLTVAVLMVILIAAVFIAVNGLFNYKVFKRSICQLRQMNMRHG